MGKAFIKTVSYARPEEVISLHLVKAKWLYGECQHMDRWGLLALIRCSVGEDSYAMVYPRDDGTFEIIDERWGYFLPAPHVESLRKLGHLLAASTKKIAVMKSLKMLVEAV